MYWSISSGSRNHRCHQQQPQSTTGVTIQILSMQSGHCDIPEASILAGARYCRLVHYLLSRWPLCPDHHISSPGVDQLPMRTCNHSSSPSIRRHLSSRHSSMSWYSYFLSSDICQYAFVVVAEDTTAITES